MPDNITAILSIALAIETVILGIVIIVALWTVYKSVPTDGLRHILSELLPIAEATANKALEDAHKRAASTEDKTDDYIVGALDFILDRVEALANKDVTAPAAANITVSAPSAGLVLGTSTLPATLTTPDGHAVAGEASADPTPNA